MGSPRASKRSARPRWPRRARRSLRLHRPRSLRLHQPRSPRLPTKHRLRRLARMAEISAALVKELRERTGAGMMECKKALVETKGDVDEAAKLLREKGIAQAAKRSGRETTEGKVAADLEETYAGMVAVGCETEPVSNNE